MPFINKIRLGGVTYTLSDVTSNYSNFSASPTMPSTTSGSTLVGTFSYRTMNTTTGSLGSTTTVNFYSTGGSVGNDWTATVTGTNLNLSRGSIPANYIAMPDLVGDNEVDYTVGQDWLRYLNAGFEGAINVKCYQYDRTTNTALTTTFTETTPLTAYGSLRPYDQSVAAGTMCDPSTGVMLSCVAYKMPSLIGMTQSDFNNCALPFINKTLPDSWPSGYVVQTQSISPDTYIDARGNIMMSLTITVGSNLGTLLGTMPNLSSVTPENVFSTLNTAGILSLNSGGGGGITTMDTDPVSLSINNKNEVHDIIAQKDPIVTSYYTVLCQDLSISYYSSIGFGLTTLYYVAGDTIATFSLIVNDTTNYMFTGQSPAAGASVYTTTSVSYAWTTPSGGNVM